MFPRIDLESVTNSLENAPVMAMQWYVFFLLLLFVNYELIRTYLYFLFSNDDSSIRNDSVIRAAPRSCLVDNIGACDDSDIGGHNTKQRDLESPQFQSDYSELLSITLSSEMYGIKNIDCLFYYKLLR